MKKDQLASEMRSSSPELVIGNMIEPVGLRVVTVGFEIYTVGFLSFGTELVRRLTSLYGIYKCGYVPAQAYKAFQVGRPDPLHLPSSDP